MPPTEPAYSVVVYDRMTGEVLLVHHFGAMPGAKLPDTEHLHEIALYQAARRHKREPSSMQVLKIPASAIEPKRSYRVSLSDGRLVEDQASLRK